MTQYAVGYAVSKYTLTGRVVSNTRLFYTQINATVLMAKYAMMRVNYQAWSTIWLN